MHQLNDPKLLEQCKRIKNMIAQVAQDPKHKNDYYAKRHHWKLSPPADLAEIEQFEQYAEVTLPTEYVYYLTQVGRGGAFPGTGLDDFDAEDGKKQDRLKFVSEALCEVMTEKEWMEKFEDEGLLEDGILDLCGMDITYIAYLIVSGPLAGRVVYLDYNGDTAPMWPKGCPDFLTWCEEFYSELLAGYDINPTWKFMWMQHGDVADLINAFEKETSIENKEDILLSFTKFDTLSQESLDFFKSITDSKFQEIIQTVIEYFEKKSKK